MGSPTPLVGNEAVRQLGQEILALEEPVSSEFVRELVLDAIDDPLPGEFLAGETLELFVRNLPAAHQRDQPSFGLPPVL